MNLILSTKTPTGAFEHEDSDNRDTFNMDIVYIVLGAGSSAVAFVLIIVLFIIFYKLHW